MKCCVGTCNRAAKVAVTFAATGAEHPYCGWHSTDSRTGELRWPAEAIGGVRNL